MKKAFTVLELLIVVAILSMLIAIALKNISQARRGRGEDSFEQVNIKGHSYLREKIGAKIMPLIHDPECAKCKNQKLEN